MRRSQLRCILLLAIGLAVLLAACGLPSPAGGPTPTPPASEADRAATAAANATAIAEQVAATVAVNTTAIAEAATATVAANPTAIAEQVAATVATLRGTTLPIMPGNLATRTPWAGAGPVLPAQIYMLSAEPAQVLRVELTAADYRQISFEQQPVVELAVPSEAGAIFYLVGEPDDAERTLVALSGAGRRELLSGQLTQLVVSPDGQRIYVRLDEPGPGLIVGQDEAPAGVWSTTPDGGRPGLVIADAPADGIYDEAAPTWTYSPIAVSPDGTRLAVYAYDHDGPAIPGGELVILADEGPPVRGPTCCELPVWSLDSKVLHTSGGGPGPDLRYGLYVNDAATGDERPVIEAAPAGPVPLVTAPRQLGDGQLYAFVELAPAEGFSWDYPFRPALSRVAPDGTVTPLAPPVAAPLEALWADNGSGAVLAAFAPEYGRPNQLFWQPADGQPATMIPFVGGDLAWVPANASLADGDCAAFSTLAFEEQSTRQPDPAIYDVQARLRPLGFDAGLPDGLYGEQTRAAVTAFQQSRGLPATGDVDCATWQAMLAQP